MAHRSLKFAIWILTMFLVGCTMVFWSDNVQIYQDTGIGDDKLSATPLLDKMKEVKNDDAK